MPIFERRSVMPVPVEELFAWHARPGAFERLNPPFAPAEIVERSGGLEVGARTVIRVPVGPVKQRWVAEHTAFEAGRSFRDEQVSGPFGKWAHTHRFEPHDAGTSELIDGIDYELPLGAVGGVFGGPFARATLERTFAYRHAVTRNDLARHAAFASKPRLTFAVTGASGLIAGALLPFLTAGGHVARGVRRSGADFDASALEGADVVVNLAGAGVADARWTAARKRLLAESRVDFTRRLVQAAGGLKRPPRVWLQGSAIGVYGDRGDEVLTESSTTGGGSGGPAGFLAKLCEDWEAEGAAAAKQGARVVSLRTGLVQSSSGGALPRLLTPFLAGGGGPLSDGRGWQSWVSLEDVLGAVLHLAYADDVQGPVNLVAPHPVTSAEYAKTLGRVVSRPALVAVPRFALRALFGELADGALLASQKVLPERLTAAGFRFLHPMLEDALRFTLGR